MISREILRILINIFRIKSIGSSNKSLESSNNPFETIFEKNLNINHYWTVIVLICIHYSLFYQLMFFLCAQVIDGLDGRELTMFFNRKYAITIVLSLRVLSEIIREWVLSQIQLRGDVRSGVVIKDVVRGRKDVYFERATGHDWKEMGQWCAYPQIVQNVHWNNVRKSFIFWTETIGLCWV